MKGVSLFGCIVSQRAKGYVLQTNVGTHAPTGDHSLRAIKNTNAEVRPPQVRRNTERAVVSGIPRDCDRPNTAANKTGKPGGYLTAGASPRNIPRPRRM